MSLHLLAMLAKSWIRMYGVLFYLYGETHEAERFRGQLENYQLEEDPFAHSTLSLSPR